MSQIEIDNFELNDCLSVAENAANKAGEILRRYFADLSQAGATTKIDGDGYDGIVTKADLEAEQTIVAEIKRVFPGHQILAEEEYAELPTESSGGETVSNGPHLRAMAAEHLWIIDPLDGTNNFAHGISHYAVSIAYYHKGVAQVGLVSKPETGERFSAIKGQGAWVVKADGTRTRARVNGHASLEETMVAVGFYYDRGEMMRSTLAAIERLFEANIHGIRRMGTAALDIVQVGVGSFGAFFEYQLSPWDFAAARLFLEEAGGRVTTCENSELPIAKSSLLATNGHLHDVMMSIVGRE